MILSLVPSTLLMALGNMNAWAPFPVAPTVTSRFTRSSKVLTPVVCQKLQTSVSDAMEPSHSNFMGSMSVPRMPRMESSMLLARILANSVPSFLATA